jgi:Fe-S cluster assembly scaffold protein SufB
MNNKITINQDSKSNVIFNYSFVANDKCHLNIDTNLKGNDNESEINVKAVTERDGSATIIGTADAKEKIVNNDLVENIKVLVLNEEESVCIPNLLVATNEVTVNHACTISSIDPDSLFYLESKGLNEKEAIKLIKNGYLIGNLSINEEIKKEILSMIEGE